MSAIENILSRQRGETRRLTRFPNIGHTPCVMNRPPTTINVRTNDSIAEQAANLKVA